MHKFFLLIDQEPLIKIAWQISVLFLRVLGKDSYREIRINFPRIIKGRDYQKLLSAKNGIKSGFFKFSFIGK